MPVYDQMGTKVQFKVLGSSLNNTGVTSTYEVDHHCRLIPSSSLKSNGTQESNIGTGIYGIGIGYSLKTTDNLVQAE